MTQANIKDIKHIADRASLPYGLIKNSNKLAHPFTVDDHYNIGVALYDQNGNPLSYVDEGLKVSSVPFEVEIARGNIAGFAPWDLTGANADVDATEETVWGVGGVYVPPTAAMQLEIVSTSNEDSGAGGVNPAGTGIREVHVHYLDDSFVEKQDTVTLDGTTVVTTNATDIYRVQAFHGSDWGTAKAAVGTIDLRNLANTPIYAEIVAGKNRAIQAFTTVPTGKAVYMGTWNVGGGNQLGNRFVRFILALTQDPDGVYQNGVWHDYGYTAIQDGAVDLSIFVPMKVVAGVDIRVNAVSDSATANALVASFISGWVEAL